MCYYNFAFSKGEKLMKANNLTQESCEQMITFSEQLLSNEKTNRQSRIEIACMKRIFEDYTGKVNNKTSEILTSKEIITELNNKMGNDLREASLLFWERLAKICWDVQKVNFPEYKFEKKIEIDELIKVTLKFFKEVDKNLYKEVNKILKAPNTYIYLNKFGQNNFYLCKPINLNIIAVDDNSYKTFPFFTHELIHALESKKEDKYPFVFSETASITFEILECDFLNRQRFLPDLYSLRINSNNRYMIDAFEYFSILEKFDKNSRKLNFNNIGTILGVDSEDGLREFYRKYEKINYLLRAKYILSFFRSIQIRQEYYNDKKVALSELNNIASGKSVSIGAKEAESDYNQYIDEVKSLFLTKD